MSEIAISTWSLHRALGPRYRPAEDGSGRLLPDDDRAGRLNLLDLPAQISARGIQTLEICHFHFPHLDRDYIQTLRTALAEAGVSLFSILIDAGDLTHTNPAQRAADLAWIQSWLEIAAACGATHARVIAGDADIELNGSPAIAHEVIQMSAAGLRSLAKIGRDLGVQVITENFRPLTRRPEHLLAILKLCEGEVGLCADFGNYAGPTKYDDLTAILSQATSVHAKAHYPQVGNMDRDDFVRCLELARTAKFDGPYSLIFDDEGDEWASLTQIKQLVSEYLN